jgi:hypothetical protein
MQHLLGKHAGNGRRGRLDVDGNIILKWISNTDLSCGLYSAGFEYYLMMDPCEHSHEPSGSKVAGKFLHSWVYMNVTAARKYFYGSTALVSLGLFIVEVSRSHSLGLLWTIDRPVAETCT